MISWRRLPVAAALAVLVALTAHEAGFGLSHIPGGTHGGELIGAALSALALLLVVGVLWVAFGRSRPLSRAQASDALAASLPGAGNVLFGTAFLSLGGLAALAGLEALEGHAPLAGWAPLLVPLCAAGIALFARALTGKLADLGLKIAARAGTFDFGFPRLTMLAASAAPAVAGTSERRANRGRAPPQ